MGTTAGPRGLALTTNGTRGLALTTVGPRGLALTTAGQRGLALTTAGTTGLALTKAGPRGLALTSNSCITNYCSFLLKSGFSNIELEPLNTFIYGLICNTLPLFTYFLFLVLDLNFSPSLNCD